MSENALLFYDFVSIYSICVPRVLLQTKLIAISDISRPVGTMSILQSTSHMA